MRSVIKLLLVLIIPIQSFAQDTVKLKRQAEATANAVIKKDFETVANHTYPKILKAAGGREKMIQMIKLGMQEMQVRGFTLDNATVGSPGKFYKAGKEIHCLLPEMVVIKSNNSRLVNHTNLLAISKDGGNFWYFLDINQSNYKMIPKIFPNFNKNLIIPAPSRPGLQQ